MSDPKVTRRGVATGMLGPGAQYDPSVISQMQSAINDLAKQIDEFRKAISGPSPRVKALDSEDEAILPANNDPAPTHVTTAYKGHSRRYAREDHVHVDVGVSKWQPYDGDTE